MKPIKLVELIKLIIEAYTDPKATARSVDGKVEVVIHEPKK